MTTENTVTSAMMALEDEAGAILGNPHLTWVERTEGIGRLLRKYRVLREYQRALADFVRRMRRLEAKAGADKIENTAGKRAAEFS